MDEEKGMGGAIIDDLLVLNKRLSDLGNVKIARMPIADREVIY